MSRPLVDVLFPGDPSVGAAEASEEFARQKSMARRFKELAAEYEEMGLDLPPLRFLEHDARMLERNRKQDRDSKCQPLTESEALWRIELAILRVARALEN